MAAPAVPSVLQHPPTFAPPSSSSSSLSPAGAASSPAPSPPPGHVRCSQCKKTKPLDEYPLRLINLRPYQVCTAHAWYWTQAKQLSQWAPTHRTSLGQVCNEAAGLTRGQKDAHGKWLVEARGDDRQALVDRIAAAGNWSAEEVVTRPSTAKGDAAPSPTWVYTLWPSSTSASPAPNPQELFKLQLWHHAAAHAFTVTLRADGATKDAAPWARPGRVRPPQGKGVRNAPPAPPAPVAPSSAPNGPPPCADNAIAAPPQPKKRRPRFATAAPSSASMRSAERDREQMPPPPVPSARPAKKARRVEPQLVSRTPTSLASNGLNTPFSAATSEWSHFLSFPTLLQPQAPAPAPRQTGPQQQQQQQHGNFPLDPLLLSAFSSASPSSSAGHPAAPSPRHEARPLSLAELLSSAIFEPPIIDLPPRPSYQSQHAATGRSAPSRTGRALDAAVADALGATPDALDSGEEEEEDGSGDDDASGYYEDSIPDESSAEEDDDDEEGDADGRGGGDGASVSSFFESSAEETEYGSASGEEDDEDDEGEDNWLEGFAAQQMGLRRGEPEEEELDEEEDEDDELSEGDDAVAAAPAKRRPGRGPARARNPPRGIRETDDEVDELDSPSSGGEEH